jgi:sugar/nucleoside kinase (ribokinase family)
MTAPVVVLGDVMLDVLAELSGPLQLGSDMPAPIHFHGGGSAANTAAWLAQSGIPSALVARVGDDVAARSALAGLRELGVELVVSTDHERPTGTCLVIVHGTERTMIPSTGANAALTPDDLPDLAAARHLHVSGYSLFTGARSAALAAIAAARAAAVPISVGAASVGPLQEWGAEAFFDAVGPGVLLFANGHEAAMLSGRKDPAEAARVIAGRTGEAVVTDGSDGAYWSDGTTLVFAETFPLDTPNPVGAGDAAAAGFLAARLAGGRPSASLAEAHRLGAEACLRPDGRPPYRA